MKYRRVRNKRRIRAYDNRLSRNYRILFAHRQEKNKKSTLRVADKSRRGIIDSYARNRVRGERN